MNTRRYVLPVAGILAVAGCASTKQAQLSPAEQQIQQAQKQSEEQLKQAQEAQRKATDQMKKAQEARRETLDAQKKLNEARQREQQEVTKAQQLQQDANRKTQQASNVVQQHQQTASSRLAQESQRTMRGEHVVVGRVTRSGPNQVTVRTQGGDTMAFKIDPQTQVQIDGRRATTNQIQQGADARVSFTESATQPKAVSIDIEHAYQPEGGASQQGMGSSSQGTGTTGR